MDKENRNALTEQYKNVKSGNNDVTTKKRKGSFLGGDVEVEDLPEMKFEKKSTVKKRTPEEIEAARLALIRPKKQYEEPSLLEKAKRTISGVYEYNVGRSQNDYNRMKRGNEKIASGL